MPGIACGGVVVSATESGAGARATFAEVEAERDRLQRIIDGYDRTDAERDMAYTIERLELALSRFSTDFGDDGPCESCGVRYPAWWVDHDIWNRTLGGPGAKGDPGGMLCPNCFFRRAEPVRGAWHITLPVKPSAPPIRQRLTRTQWALFAAASAVWASAPFVGAWVIR